MRKQIKISIETLMHKWPVFAAAKSLKCSATGVEIDETFYGIALAQIEKVSGQGELL